MGDTIKGRVYVLRREVWCGVECLPVCLLFEKVIKRNLVLHIYLHWDLYFISPPKMGLGGQGTVQEKNDRERHIFGLLTYLFIVFFSLRFNEVVILFLV